MSEKQPSVEFIIEFGIALHRYGTPAHRLEAALSSLAETYGLQSQFMSTPTSIIMGFGNTGAMNTTLLRLEPGVHNLEKLAAVDELAERISKGDVSTQMALQELQHIKTAKNKLGNLATTLAYPIISGASSIIIGGGFQDLLVSMISGLAIGLLALLVPRTLAGGRIFELLAAFLVGISAHLAASTSWGVSYKTSLLAGLIVLVPGLSLTIGMTEVATGNLVSGTARLMSSALVFLKIIFGIAMAEQILTHFVGIPPEIISSRLPIWTELLALAISCIAIAALFKAHPKAIPIIAVTSLAAFFSARIGALHLSSELGACVGGFVAAAIANSYARIRNRSAMVPLVPGILLLVPGSLGFKSLSSLWAQDIVGGIDGAFKMVLVAISLVAGILVANAVILPRRSL